LQPIEFRKIFKGGSDREITLLQMREFSAKAGRQAVKDYVAFPALTSLSPAATYKSTLKANAVAASYFIRGSVGMLRAVQPHAGRVPTGGPAVDRSRSTGSQHHQLGPCTYHRSTPS
jgi:hypothetical protein